MPDSLADSQLKQLRDGTVGATPQAVTGVAGATVVVSSTAGTPVVVTAVSTGLALGAASTSNTFTISKVLSAASTNAAFIKAAAGRVYSLCLSNTTAAWKFVKLYNKATAPVVGTDIPTITIGIPPNGCVTQELPYGIPFGTGIAIAITNLVADADATAVAAGDVTGYIGYL